MHSVLSLLAAPAAATAAGMARGAAAAAAKPFDALLQAAVGRAEAAGSARESCDTEPLADDREALESRLAEKLQELLTSLGIAAGESISIRFDATTGSFDVDDDQSLATLVEEAIGGDAELANDLARLAELECDSSELQVEVGAEGEAARIEWTE